MARSNLFSLNIFKTYLFSSPTRICASMLWFYRKRRSLHFLLGVSIVAVPTSFVLLFCRLSKPACLGRFSPDLHIYSADSQIDAAVKILKVVFQGPIKTNTSAICSLRYCLPEAFECSTSFSCVCLWVLFLLLLFFVFLQSCHILFPLNILLVLLGEFSPAFTIYLILKSLPFPV